jgi:hypothetical protein
LPAIVGQQLRKRRDRAGAQLIVPDFRETDALVRYLFAGGESRDTGNATSTRG